MLYSDDSLCFKRFSKCLVYSLGDGGNIGIKHLAAFLELKTDVCAISPLIKIGKSSLKREGKNQHTVTLLLQ